jgi:hypothetical protein
MANIPVLRSKEQILGDLVDGFLARVDTVNDLSRQSVLMQFLNAVAQVNFKAYADIIQTLDALSVDRAVGEALQRLARDKNVPILSGRAASGKVEVTDISISKISSLVYAGQPAPVAGSSKLYVADASKFSASGFLYIGRKTPNNEGPLKYTSVQAEGGGAYWSITLATTSLTTKFHNIGEEVVLAQGGDRIVSSGTIMQTPQGSAVTSVTFRSLSSATILDGEILAKDIPVVALDTGSKGNIPKGAIKEALGLTFQASVTNPNPFTNGTPPDTDDVLRNRIKDYEQAKSKGTENSIKVAALNVVSSDELKKVISSSVVRYTDNSAALVFDDGGGYEPLFYGVGLEQVVDEALGGEADVQLRKRPIAQARVKNNLDGPYSINDGDSLDVEIQNVVVSHSFASSDFQVPSSATLDEIVNSINSNSVLHFYASTADNGTRLVLYPRDRTKNDIKVNSRTLNDVNLILGFPNTISYTIRLYKTDIPLYQDGLLATVDSKLKSVWATNIAGPVETLTYVIDNAPEITTTLTDSDFQSFDPTTSLSANTPITIWAEVLNVKMPGVTVTVNGEILTFISNLGQNSRAMIHITGGTLRNKMFAVGASLLSTGQTSDFDLNRQTGQIALKVPLIQGESLVAGSAFTRAKFLTSSIPLGPTSNGNIWLAVDGNTSLVPNGMRTNTRLDFLNLGLTKLKITGTNASTLLPEGFGNFSVGDYLLIWTDNNDSINYPVMAAHAGYWVIESVKTGEIIVTVGDNSGFSNGFELSIPTDRLVGIKTSAPIQQLSFPASTLSAFIQLVESTLEGVSAAVLGARVRISTNTAGDNGEMFIIAADTGGKNLGALAGTRISNITSSLGFTNTSDSEVTIPTFTFGSIETAVNDFTAHQTNFLGLQGKVGLFMEMMNQLESGAEIIDSNKNRRSFISKFDESSNDIIYKTPKYMKAAQAIQTNDRFILRNSYMFDSKDTLTIIGDGDATTKTYTLPVARRLKVSAHSTPSLQDFSADDVESGLLMSDSASFYNFDFSGFKIWRQAQVQLNSPDYDISIKSVDFGPNGNNMAVGFTYPTSITQTAIDISAQNDQISIKLPVKTPRISNWNGSSAFTVSKTTSGAKDVVTYTWRIGDEPNFSATGANVSIGDIAIINANTNFLTANKGLEAKVTNLTATTFTIDLPTGTIVNDELSFNSVINLNGKITVICNAPHNLVNGDRVGFYDTQAVSSGVTPFDFTYYVTVVNSTSFVVDTPLTVPGGSLIAATHSANTVTITSPNHGLQIGNIILVSGCPVINYNGTYPVSNVLNANQFQYIVIGSSASISSGRFDYQTYENNGAVTVGLTSGTQTGNTVTFTSSTAHGLTAGTLATLQSVNFASWSNATAYVANDIVRYLPNGLSYVCLVANTNSDPSTTSNWALTSLTLNQTTIITSTPTTTTFTVNMPFTNTKGSVGGVLTPMKAAGKLARCLGASGELLAFAEVSVTAQDLVDEINVAYADYLTAVNNGLGADIIDTSTADNDISSDYLSGTITLIKKVQGYNVFSMIGNIMLPAGSIVKVSGIDRQIIRTVQSGSLYEYFVLGDVATATSSTVVSIAFTGYTPAKFMVDGENFVLSNNLQSLLAIPMFLCNNNWTNAPAIGEELRVIAQTADQLTRFWNKLVVSGLANIASIQLSEYGRQIQITSNLFGSTGSIQIAGGLANSGAIAVVGSASETAYTGSFQIPYESRVGLSSGYWISIDQTVRLNKAISLDSTSVLRTYNDGLQIVSGSGSFQTEITTSIAAGSLLKVEKHGNFQAFIGLSNLGLTNVTEGSKVRIKNNAAYTAWSSLTTYSVNAVVEFDGLAWRCLITHVNQTPSTASTYWKRLGVDSVTEGIYQVVRVFGDTFWIENSNIIEEMVELSSSSEIRFFTYDSIMPNDTLIIAGTSLGTTNIGRYTVVDEAFGPGYLFPTATRIYTTPLPFATGSGVAVGDAFNQINIEEGTPIRLMKKIASIVPSFGLYATVIVDTPNLMNKISSSSAASLTMQGKLEFPIQVNFGVDSYRFYGGLIAELNRVIYGDPTNPSQYPGTRAAGTDIDIKPSIIKKIKIAVTVRIRTGTPFVEIRERVKTSIAGYVNTLGVGDQVSLSKVIEAAQKINGVIAIVINSPTYTTGTDLIYVGADQRAQIVDPTSDVTVSIQGT